jgi:hypothetical protein
VDPETQPGTTQIVTLKVLDLDLDRCLLYQCYSGRRISTIGSRGKKGWKKWNDWGMEKGYHPLQVSLEVTWS